MSIVDLIYPKLCAGCGREGRYICAECEKKLVTPPAICPMCCQPSVGGWTHYRCRVRGSMDRLTVGLPYRGMIQSLLKKVKYKSAWDIIGQLFLLWQKHCSDIVTQLHSDTVITSVPMWHTKEGERGFNQAAMIAQNFATFYKVPYLAMLRRTRPTPPMFGLNKKQRRTNVAGVFVPIDHEVQTKRVLLVDDVWTTGSTMRECARVLKRAGAQYVCGVTLAR